MRWAVAVMALAPGAAAAGDWQALDGPGIQAALTARVLGFPDGRMQDYFADGTILSGEKRGLWKVEGDRYCETWRRSGPWTCLSVAAQGLDIRFVAKDGTKVIGRHVDLQ